MQKRVKPHLGTDYAAPTGTTILSTAYGYVERAGYGKGNGNYVGVLWWLQSVGPSPAQSPVLTP